MGVAFAVEGSGPVAAGTRDGRRPGPLVPRAIPAYTKVEASRYLRIPHRTLHNWVSGGSDRSGRPAAPLVSIADPAQHLLSFENMLELHVLAALRHVHGIRMRIIRRALDFLQTRLEVARPLIDKQMHTDGKTILVHHLEQLVDVGQEGQTSMLELLDVHLDRIERDPSGIATKLFLFTRKSPLDRDAAEREPRFIAIDPAVAFGRAVITGSRVSTAEVADRYKAGDSIADLVEDYGRTAPEIEEAIRCELNLKAA